MFKLASYITFHGDCKEATMFYKKIFEPAEVTMTTFIETMPQMGISVPQEAEGLISRSELVIRRDGASFGLVFCDSPTLLFMPSGKKGTVDNISLELCSDDKDWLRLVFDKLMDGGKINIAIRENANGEIEGSLIDRYGICWIFSSRG